MRFDIRYRTAFIYENLVRDAHNELRACPVSDAHQQLLSYRVSTRPHARVLSFTDYWGTRVDAFGLREPHVSLEVTAEATVETRPRPLVTASPPLTALEDPEWIDRHAEFLETTSHTSPGPHIEAAVAHVRDGATDVVDLSLAVHRYVHAKIDYEPGSTAIGVDADAALGGGHGVCQDYAHVAVTICRALGVPARYVSGYFFAASDATGEDVSGDVVEVATHAWFEAAVPGFGWLALDPTNALQVGPRHITIGRGRDYDDVQPIRGVYSGAGVASMEAIVEMRRLQAVQAQQQQ